MSRSRSIVRICTVTLLTGLVLALAIPPAFAHGDGMQDPAMAGTGTAPVTPGPNATPVSIMIEVPPTGQLGGTITATATLTDADGMAIAGAMVVFETDAVWGAEFQGHMAIGSAETNDAGVASITYQLRTSGDVEVAAAFAGDHDHLPAEEETSLKVAGDQQLYSPSVGLRIPWLNLWVLAAVIMLVWSVYLAVGRRVIRIFRLGRVVAASAGTGRSSTRREFLRGLLPLGTEAAIATFGLGLVTVVARSPHTHGNLMDPPSTAAYGRSPVARVGQMAEMRQMPSPLSRDVSFSSEVLPIFLANGGPHVVLPQYSPAPGGLQLDSHEHVLAKDGVVVPGDPEASEIVAHLLSAGMQMPPSIPPLPDEQIQLIVTWIAQGARNN